MYKQDYVSKYNNNLVKECLIDEYCNYNQLKLLNPDPIKNINLSAGVLLIAAEVTIKGLIKKPWGWGLNNYGQAHAHFNDKNQLNWTKFFANHYIIRDLNKNDGSSTFLKMIEEIASPYHSGLGLIYIEEIIGEKNFKDLVRSVNTSRTREELNNLFINYSNVDLTWFVQDYIGKRQSIDLKIKRINKNEIEVYEKNNILIPYSVGFLKNDSIIETRFFEETLFK